MLAKLKNKHPKYLSTCLELLAIALFALWVTKPYLNFDRLEWPTGNEFASTVQYNYIWTFLPKCGLCMLWNGSLNGGAPALAELDGSVLHPVTVLTTLIWGPVSGSKVAIAFSFVLAGWAQWWIAKTLKLGWVARMWSGAMAVVGGQLAGRMELGTGVLDVASCALVIAPGLSTVLYGRRRDIVLFGLLVGLAMLAGAGYQQVGMVLAMIPAFLIFIFNSKLKFTPVLKKFAVAAVIAVLISGIFWVPMLHLWPSITKHMDPQFGAAQPMAYAPLNLVIPDKAFQYNTDLGKNPYPSLNSIYIGWVPILLAVLAIRAPKSKKEIQIFLFFIASILLVFLTSSAATLKILALIGKDLVAGIRHPSVISASAVPYILGLAAWGLDWLVKKAWPMVGFQTRVVSFTLATKILLAIPLILAIVSCYNFGRYWIATADVPQELWSIAATMRTKYATWVTFPIGEHFWMVPGLDEGLKIGTAINRWTWKDRDLPASRLIASRDPVDGANATQDEPIFGLTVYERPEVSYAYILIGNQKVPCNATAQGGNIDLACDSSAAGILIVSENYFPGWKVQIDGQPATVIPFNHWLAVRTPPGSHTYKFRYRPWDVPVGMLVSMGGAAFVIWLLFRKRKKAQAEKPIQGMG